MNVVGLATYKVFALTPIPIGIAFTFRHTFILAGEQRVELRVTVLETVGLPLTDSPMNETSKTFHSRKLCLDVF